jgi:hypothetical protein
MADPAAGMAFSAPNQNAAAAGVTLQGLPVRRIAHDDAKHAPICRRIVVSLCGDDATKWAESSPPPAARGLRRGRAAR